MKVLIIGNGGREHTLLTLLKNSQRVKTIYTISPNGGMAPHSRDINIPMHDVERIADFALSEKIDLTVVGPEIPLVYGIVDEFEMRNLLIFGPNKRASQLEGSKIFTKEFCKKYNIPSASFKIFSDSIGAREYINGEYSNKRVVVKADGLAQGKGVKVCENKSEACQFISAIMDDKIFGKSGDRIIIEESLTGHELSYMVLTDGKNVLPLATARDYKRIYDNDLGPNTGGMGTYSPSIKINEKLENEILHKIIYPTITALKKENIEYKGVLYAGVMVTDDGVKLLEYNVRFGDPETQTVLTRLNEEILPILESTARGNLDGIKLRWKDNVSICVVLAQNGYPEKYKTGFLINNHEKYSDDKNTFLFHAGTKIEKGKLVTNGGRVMGVTVTADKYTEAYRKVYEICNDIDYEGKYYRRDIGCETINYDNLELHA